MDSFLTFLLDDARRTLEKTWHYQTLNTHMQTFREYLHEANQKAVLIAVPKNPRDGDGKGFWKIGNDVYRASIKGATDTSGYPADKRWESSFDHFVRYWQSMHDKFYTKTKDWK